MRARDHFRRAVYTTPFHARTAALNQLNLWHRWRDYTVADAFFDVSLEYAAIRNACAVFDLSPMTKHLVGGPHARASAFSAGDGLRRAYFFRNATR